MKKVIPPSRPLTTAHRSPLLTKRRSLLLDGRTSKVRAKGGRRDRARVRAKQESRKDKATDKDKQQSIKDKVTDKDRLEFPMDRAKVKVKKSLLPSTGHLESGPPGTELLNMEELLLMEDVVKVDL